LFFFNSLTCQAMSGWSWNLGYNNPPGAQVGLNFMHLWSQWAFEVGIGGVSQSQGVSATTGEETKSTSVLGDLNLKYLFSSGTFRPYLQVGTGTAASIVSHSGTSVSAGVGGIYYGGGLFLMSSSFYVYLSLNSGGGSSYSQAGLGFNF
nr:hypothetical protein [Pseudobdellovibrionaceae bacterium]